MTSVELHHDLLGSTRIAAGPPRRERGPQDLLRIAAGPRPLRRERGPATCDVVAAPHPRRGFATWLLRRAIWSAWLLLMVFSFAGAGFSFAKAAGDNMIHSRLTMLSALSVPSFAQHLRGRRKMKLLASASEDKLDADGQKLAGKLGRGGVSASDRCGQTSVRV